MGKGLRLYLIDKVEGNQYLFALTAGVQHLDKVSEILSSEGIKPLFQKEYGSWVAAFFLATPKAVQKISPLPRLKQFLHEEEIPQLEELELSGEEVVLAHVPFSHLYYDDLELIDCFFILGFEACQVLWRDSEGKLHLQSYDEARETFNHMIYIYESTLDRLRIANTNLNVCSTSAFVKELEKGEV